eukprot:6175032-Pleurochrysis_carterae.AAC.2
MATRLLPPEFTSHMLLESPAQSKRNKALETSLGRSGRASLKGRGRGAYHHETHGAWSELGQMKEVKTRLPSAHLDPTTLTIIININISTSM